MPNPPGEIPDDVAAELRLLRAEITAMRGRPAGWVRPRQRKWLPEMTGGQVIQPERHYRVARALRGRLYRRATVKAIGPELINRQRQRAINLLLFGGIRIVLWTVLAVLIGCGLLGFGDFHWAKILAESIPFVVMISLYANWATDVDAATAAFAALVAADVHREVADTSRTLAEDIDALSTDVARLAALDSGDPEALRLAADIRRRLAGVPAIAAGRRPPPEPGAFPVK
jgi:hypothetical protein